MFFVELGKLDEAEKKYQQCLAADPKDTKAAQELEYVRGRANTFLSAEIAIGTTTAE